MTVPDRARYRRTNWKSRHDAPRRWGSLLIWLNKEMEWFAPKACHNGRPPVFSGATIQSCLMVHVLFGLPLLRTTGQTASIQSMVRLDWPVPGFSNLSRRQKTMAVQITQHPASGPVNRFVDGTGIKLPGDGNRLTQASRWLPDVLPADPQYLQQSSNRDLFRQREDRRLDPSGSWPSAVRSACGQYDR